MDVQINATMEPQKMIVVSITKLNDDDIEWARDNSEPWISNPSSVVEFWEIACKVNETVAKWAPPQDNSSKS